MMYFPSSGGLAPWLSLSVLTHFILGLFLVLLVKVLPFESLSKPPTIVEILDHNWEKSLFFLKEVETPLKPRTDPSSTEPKVYSKTRRYFDVAQQARLIGPTINSLDVFKQMSSNSDTQAGKALTNDGPAEFQAWIRPQNFSVGSQPSSISFHIPGVKMADFTILSSESFPYYSFFVRIEDKLRPLWVWHLNHVLHSSRARPDASSLEGVAQVILDSSGVIQRVDWVKMFGFEPADKATLAAIWEAGRFEHPPADLLQEGQVLLMFRFKLVFE